MYNVHCTLLIKLYSVPSTVVRHKYSAPSARKDSVFVKLFIFLTRKYRIIRLS